jgi:hypothetical protein
MKQGKENDVDEVIVNSMIWMEREMQVEKRACEKPESR